MAAFALLVLALFAGAVCSTTEASRIVGGWPVTIDEWPSLVQVDFPGVNPGAWIQSCAANILNSRHVLSAAHCFTGPLYAAERRRIRAGTTFRNANGMIVYVEREFNHPSYGVAARNDGDITVVRLREPLIYSSVIKQGIFSSSTTIRDNIPVVYAGWGRTRQGGVPSFDLRETIVNTVNHDFCATRYLTLPEPQIVTRNMICAGRLGLGGRDACQGDSGGPLYYQDPIQGDIIIGVVSWGHGCGNGTFPGVNTAVGPYINWVISIAN